MKVEIKKYSSLISSLVIIWLIYMNIQGIYKILNGLRPHNTGIFWTLHIISLSIFGLMLIMNVIKFADRKAGFEILKDGISFRPNIFQKAKVSWNDILIIDYRLFQKRKLIVPILKYPEDIISNQTNMIGKWVMKTNLKQHGSPIVMIMENYSANFDEVKNEIDNNFTTLPAVAQS